MFIARKILPSDNGRMKGLSSENRKLQWNKPEWQMERTFLEVLSEIEM